MALKRIITKAEHAKLSDLIKSEYKADADGENFTLDLTDYEDPGALKRAKDHVNAELKEAKKAANELKDQLAALTEERDGLLSGSIPKSDVEKLRGSYDSKLAKREKELTTQIDGLTGNLKRILVDNEAQRLASELSTSPHLMLPHLKARLAADFENGTAVTRVLDAEGKPTALTLDDLKKEFVANKDFAPILTGSKGSGGGAAGSTGGGAVKKSLKDMTATEEAQFANANPQEYQRLIAAQ